MRGGINAKSLALKHLKSQLVFRESFEGAMVPVCGFEDWTAAANSMLSIRLIGVFYLRFAAKQIAYARQHWKNPSKQESLNVISEMLIKAEQRCKDREEKRKERRLIQGVTATGKYPAGRPAAGEDRTKGPEPKVDGRRKPVEPLPQAPVDQDALWASMEKK